MDSRTCVRRASDPGTEPDPQASTAKVGKTARVGDPQGHETGRRNHEPRSITEARLVRLSGHDICVPSEVLDQQEWNARRECDHRIPDVAARGETRNECE